MSVTNVEKDVENFTLIVTAEYDVPVDRAWQLVSDPRQLERWWGPPTHPATFVDFDLVVRGALTYYMTAPDGEQFHGVWNVDEVEPPSRLAVTHLFTDASGELLAGMPTSGMIFEFESSDTGTIFTVTNAYGSVEVMEQLLAMGQEEGLKQAMSQIDAILVG
jgi:uncharacterized protein YndB with AHSA1/START domain